ncbi:MAG: hypothetical protein HYR73_09245 [Candidatus Eisenbacteria bacterium]|nr:hypothetical protein [Candidatus Eisenbacteria bacterium]
MQRARTFFYGCAGILLLALAYHFGAGSATAQQGSMVSGFTAVNSTYYIVLTGNGDVYRRNMPGPGFSPGPLELMGNFWSGTGPTPATRESFGQLKVKYR